MSKDLQQQPIWMEFHGPLREAVLAVCAEVSVIVHQLEIECLALRERVRTLELMLPESKCKTCPDCGCRMPDPEKQAQQDKEKRCQGCTVFPGPTYSQSFTLSDVGEGTHSWHHEV